MEPSIPSAPPIQTSNSLKRPLERDGSDEESGSPTKRVDVNGPTSVRSQTTSADGGPDPGLIQMSKLVSDLEEELWCPLCAAVLHNPVIVSSCSHSFCGSCLSQYLRSSNPKPHTCPSCRSTATSAMHSRTLSALVDVLIRHAPDKKRAQAERDQADDEWAIGEALKFGHPPPPPSFARAEVYRPCRHCAPGNPNGWTCPIPVPPADSLLAYPLDGPCPEGHLSCSACSQLAASAAPTTRACGVCEAGYCGLSQASCTPSLLALTKPGLTWGSSSLSFADAIYDLPIDELACAFKDNSEELRIFADFISNRPDLTPAVVYAEIVDWVLSDEGQEKGGIRGVFKRVDESLHSNLTEGRPIERMCLPCSDDLLACGLYEWWARKRPSVFDQLDKATRAKPDCKNGRACYRQGNGAHARKFNHICMPLPGADTIEQDDHPLPISPPAVRSSSPAIADESTSRRDPGVEMAPAGGAQSLGSHPSSDAAALDNVDLGIGPSGTSGAYLSDSDDDEPVRRKPRLVEAGVQTDNTTSVAAIIVHETGASAHQEDQVGVPSVHIQEEPDPSLTPSNVMLSEDPPSSMVVDPPALAHSGTTEYASIATLDLSAPIVPYLLGSSTSSSAEPISTQDGPDDDEDEDPDRTLVSDDLDAPAFFTDMSVGQGQHPDDLTTWMEQEDQLDILMQRDIETGPQQQEQAV